MSNKADVLQANATFYSALRRGDYAAMDALWSRQQKVSVYHPNWCGIEGRDEVMASWFQVMVVAEPPDIDVTDECVILNGRRAVVLCTENVDNAQIIASNLYALEGGAWKITHHQATHLPVPAPRRGRV